MHLLTNWKTLQTQQTADEAVRQQKVKIQDANDFFAWAEKYQSNNSICYRYVCPNECIKAKEDIEEFGKLATVQGTMKLHAIVPDGLDTVYVREYIMFLCKLL